MQDYHTHTTLCKHAVGATEEYLAAAERAGLEEFGVSDHLPWPFGYDREVRMEPEQYSSYREMVSELAAKSAKVKVKYAVELDWVPGHMDEVTENIKNEEFDYILGSIHSTLKDPFGVPNYPTPWLKAVTDPAAWLPYYERMRDFVSEFDFDIIAHFDIPGKLGGLAPESEQIASLIAEILEIAADRKIAMELNTAGLRHPVGRIYPTKEILKTACAKGVNITFGSDAHSPKEVAAGFDLATTLAKECGFDHYVSFDKRVATLKSF